MSNQLAANRANAQLSTGPRTEAGKASSSKNAVKSALTGRTVLLPSDDRDEYATFLAEFQNDLEPVGQLECELVQIIADCYWRLRRIQELEYALYAQGEEQFADAFPDTPAVERPSKIMLQTHLTYEKQLRNLHIQEARIDRKRAKALKELQALQGARKAQEAAAAEQAVVVAQTLGLPSRPSVETPVPNGFVFSNDQSDIAEYQDSELTEHFSRNAVIGSTREAGAAGA